MIAYGICVGPTSNFELICRPTIPKDRIIISRYNMTSIFEAYNSILTEVLAISDLEALVLIHDDVALAPTFEQSVYDGLTTGAAIIGAIGARNPRSIAWWEGTPRGKAVETSRVFDYGGGTHFVDTVDGMVMVLAPSAFKSLRFDEDTFHGFHAYDIDLCTTARAMGMSIVVAPLDLVHHTKANRGDVNGWREADLLWKKKWRRISFTGYLSGRALLFLHRLSHRVRQG